MDRAVGSSDFNPQLISLHGGIFAESYMSEYSKPLQELKREKDRQRPTTTDLK